jgi:hypothetical protein
MRTGSAAVNVRATASVALRTGNRSMSRERTRGMVLRWSALENGVVDVPRFEFDWHASCFECDWDFAGNHRLVVCGEASEHAAEFEHEVEVW